MERSRAAALVNELIIEHGLDKYVQGWKFGGFTRAHKTLGLCDYGKREIRLSGPYVDSNSEVEVRQTILHEVAHMLTPGQNHNNVWLAKARSIGYTGHRQVKQGDVEMPDNTKWLGTCQTHTGKPCEIKYMRKPSDRTINLGRCRRHNSALHWKHVETGLVYRSVLV